MHIARLGWLTTVLCGLALFSSVGFAQKASNAAVVAPTAKVELITFEGLNTAEQAAILGRLSFQKGDALSYEARQRIAAELKAAAKEIGQVLTFSYAPGSAAGTATLRISNGC